METAVKPEERFEHELEVFRRESDEAVQHLYAYLTVHAFAGDHKSVREHFHLTLLCARALVRHVQTGTSYAKGTSD